MPRNIDGWIRGEKETMSPKKQELRVWLKKGKRKKKEKGKTFREKKKGSSRCYLVTTLSCCGP